MLETQQQWYKYIVNVTENDPYNDGYKWDHCGILVKALNY